jgi:hypothetical protein
MTFTDRTEIHILNIGYNLTRFSLQIIRYVQLSIGFIHDFMQICDRLKTSQTLDQNSKFDDTIMIHDTIVVKHFVSQITLLHT